MPLRTDVEKALDESIAEEQDFKFQGLGVVLAKQKWPRLIASERRYDLGLDAHAKADFEPDGRGIGLACSLTAEYEKIAEDATKVKENYPDVRVLVFATPGKVTKHKEKQWAEQLSKDLGLDLVVMSREELVTSLIDPSNADICRSQLGIHIEGKLELQSVIARAREAVAETIDTWALRPRLRGRPLIDLDAERVEEESHERLSVEDLRAFLAQGRRIILFGSERERKFCSSSRKRLRLQSGDWMRRRY